KTSTNVSTLETASPNGRLRLAAKPMRPGSPRTGVLLAALENPYPNEHGPLGRAVHARCGVLGRLDSPAIEPPCVRPSHAPSTPHRRVVIQAEVLGLVEEAALEHPGAILGRQLDVARSEEEDLVGNPLHPALERIREPAREVDQTLRQLRVGRLEVE